MKQVYKCDFCFYTSSRDTDVLKHEKDCTHNPDNKRCDSCKHARWGIFDYQTCLKDTDIFEVECTKCPTWELLEEE